MEDIVRPEDRAAILTIAAVLADHLREHDIEQDDLWMGPSPSDRVREAIGTLSEVTDDA